MKDRVYNVADKIGFIFIALYVLDIALFGTGAISQKVGLSSRMLFFSGALLCTIPLILIEWKDYLYNKKVWLFIFFWAVLGVSLIVGVVNGNSKKILVADVKGFLNLLIAFPMLVILPRRNRLDNLLKILSVLVTLNGIIAIVLSFYACFSADTQGTIYDLFQNTGLCGISYLTEHTARVFFHSGSRYFYVGFVLALFFSVVEKGKKRVFWMICSIISAVGVFLSFTRSLYAGLVVSIVVLVIFVLLFYKKMFKRIFINGVIVSLASVLLIGCLSVMQRENLLKVSIERCVFGIEVNASGTLNVGNDDENRNESNLINEESENTNLEVRAQRKIMAKENIRKSPIIGNGLGTVNDREGNFIEYFYLDYMSKTGLLGLLAFFAPIIYSIISWLRKENQCDEKNELLFLGVVSACIFAMSATYFNPFMNTSTGLVLYAFVLVVTEKNGYEGRRNEKIF